MKTECYTALQEQPNMQSQSPLSCNIVSSMRHQWLPTFKTIPGYGHIAGGEWKMIQWTWGHLRLAQLDEVLVSGAWWKASNIQVGFTQLFSTAVVAAVVAATVCAGAGRSHGVGSWCIGLLETERIVTGKTKAGTAVHRASSTTQKQSKLLILSTPHTCMHLYNPTMLLLTRHHYFLFCKFCIWVTMSPTNRISKPHVLLIKLFNVSLATPRLVR